jgi:hypothetical protein
VQVRRLLSMIMLLLAAWTLSPAVVAVAAIHRPIGPAPQRFGVRLFDVPGSAANNPRALRYIIDYLPTGTVIHRRILVMNQEARTAHFIVYPDAARISNGSFTGDGGATRSELTGWISVQYQTLTLRPHASSMDTITIKVPPGATRGEHYGVIWVQQAAHARTSTGLGVNEVTRVGIRVYLAVGQGGAPPTSFAITSVIGHRSASGWPSMVAHVDNTGGRAVDLSGTVRLTGGPGDTDAGPFAEQQIITLAPSQSGNVTFAPPRSLPNGPWQAKVTLMSGLATATATATVVFAVASQAGLSMVSWLGISLGVLAVAVAVAVALILAHSARQRGRAPA